MHFPFFPCIFSSCFYHCFLSPLQVSMLDSGVAEGDLSRHIDTRAYPVLVIFTKIFTITLQRNCFTPLAAEVTANDTYFEAVSRSVRV